MIHWFNLLKIVLFIVYVGNSAFLWASDPASNTAADYNQQIIELCRENNAPIKTVKVGNVFSWTDDQGNVHFGDRPPANVEAETENLGGRKDFFDITISYPNSAVSVELSQALEVNGRAISKALGLLIPSDRMTKSSIDMKVFTDHADFLVYKNSVAPTLSNNVSGFYSALENSVAVLHSGNEKLTQLIALHEATHVFQYKNIGTMPGWLSEGMAAYFENMQVKNKSKTVPISAQWLFVLKRRSSTIALRDLLTADYSRWQSRNGTSYYATSWALVHFLMLPENRVMMQRYLDIVSKDKCNEESAQFDVTFFEQHYNGGVAKLQQDLDAWLGLGPRLPNYH
jgi:hypothetical protein